MREDLPLMFVNNMQQEFFSRFRRNHFGGQDGFLSTLQNAFCGQPPQNIPITKDKITQLINPNVSEPNLSQSNISQPNLS